MDSRSAQLLRQCALFANLSAAEVSAVLQVGRERRVRRGETFFRQGDGPAGLFVLTRGRVNLVFAAPDGRQVVFQTVVPFDVFGHVAVFSESAHRFSAQALENSEAINWDAMTMRARMRDAPVMARNMLRLLAEEVRRALSLEG